MPLTSKGEKVKEAMEKEYGAKKGESVFYASRNKGTIKGVDNMVTQPSGGIPTGMRPDAEDGSYSVSDAWTGRES